MFINIKILSWVVILATIRIGYCGLDNRGKEFVVGFMRNKETNGSLANNSIFIATNAYLGAQVNVTAPLFDPPWKEEVYVPFEGVVKVTVPGEIRSTDTGIGSNGIYITSTEEVSVYGVNSDSNSTDGFVALPVDNLGRNYMVMTYNEYPVFLIVAAADYTFVSISTPSSWTGNFTFEGQLYTGSSTIYTFINRYQTLQITSDAGDLTGTKITCDPPVAVFSGSSHAAIATVGTVTSDDNHLVEQLVPEDNWGHQFVVFPTPDRYFGNILRVVGRQQTTYTLNGTSYNLTFQSFRDHELSAGTYYWLETDGQVGLGAAVFSRSYANSSITMDSSSGGAPSMILLNPISLADIYYTFSTVDHTGGNFTSNFLLLVVHTSDQNSLVLDDIDIVTTWDPVSGNSDYVGTFIGNIMPGNHTVYTKVRNRGFLAAVFGNSEGTSYGYLAGMRLTKINSACFNRPVTVEDTLDNDCDGLIDEELDNGVDDDGDGAVDEDLTVPDATDGNWGDWGPWGTCSLSCGTGPGSRSRSKPCDNPVPILPGKYCEGSSTEHEPCTPAVLNCPVDGNFGQWSVWSACSVSCNGTGTTTRVRACDDPAPAFGGSNCSGDTSETHACTTGPCPVDGNWGLWSAWSSCPVSCGVGNETRVRSCDNPLPQYNGSYCPGDGTEIRTCDSGVLCPVDGSWGSWSAWTSCDVTCGVGSMLRVRSCVNPPPSNYGSNCTGDSTETKICDTGTVCPVNGNWGYWSLWTSCSVTCGVGNKTRVRSCNNPPPSYNGSNCTGNDTETQICDSGIACPVDGNWGSWSSWSQCSVTCGNGYTTRVRSCDNPEPSQNGSNCTGDENETQTCDSGLACPVDGNWGSWSVWSQCPVTCGAGNSTRVRSCDNPTPSNNGSYCAGDEADTQACVSGVACPVDGNWGSWSAWSHCSVTCGVGSMTRVRSCDNPSPSNNGSHCTGNDTEVQTCDSGIDCPVDGNWGAWSNWSGCSVTCDTGNTTRVRTCDNPPPSNNGSSCSGDDSETMACDTGIVCPVDGNWGEWSTSQCSVTCGVGNKSRFRSCDSPPPSNNGSNCTGDNTDTQTCDSGIACPVDGNWGSWSDWTPCSVICGFGNTTRVRSCDNQPPSNNGSNCTGDSTETQACNTASNCSVDGNWGSWSAWTSCSVTCGVGNKTRVRSCDNPPSSNNGNNCTGNSSEIQTCDTATHCSVDGNWGSWSDWTPCSVTCGFGNMTRVRFCDNPSPSNIGSNCTGDSTETQACDTGTNCPDDGNWGEWSSWSSCSVTCGVGNTTRVRSCDNPPPSNNGSYCVGADTETQACDSESACPMNGSWSDWGSWSSCSETCGIGLSTRSRSCDEPAPVNGGRTCDGVDTENIPCNMTEYCLPSFHGNVMLSCVNNYTFGCQTEFVCIDVIFRCDGTFDCTDGSDESPVYTGCALALRSHSDRVTVVAIQIFSLVLLVCLIIT